MQVQLHLKKMHCTVDIKFDHDTEILHVGKNIELEDKVIVNKNIIVQSGTLQL